MPPDFSGFIKAALARSGQTMTAFASAVGRSTGNLSNILKQDPTARTQFKPPLDEMPRWAEALHLNPQQAAELMELAELCHTPAGLRDRYLSLRADTGRWVVREERAPYGFDAPEPSRAAEADATDDLGDLAKVRAANALLAEQLAVLQARVVALEAELMAHRQEQAALANLLAQPSTDHATWEPDTSALPARRVADAPAETGAPAGPHSPRTT